MASETYAPKRDVVSLITRNAGRQVWRRCDALLYSTTQANICECFVGVFFFYQQLCGRGDDSASDQSVVMVIREASEGAAAMQQTRVAEVQLRR